MRVTVLLSTLLALLLVSGGILPMTAEAAADRSEAETVLDSYTGAAEGETSARSLTAEESDLLDQYNAAEQFEQDGNFADAYSAFTSLGSFMDSEERADALREKAFYQAAMEAVEDGDYTTAYLCFYFAGDYEDSAEKAYLAGTVYYADVNDETEETAMFPLTATAAAYSFLDEWGIVNFSSNTLIHPTWDSVELLSDDRLLVEKDGLLGLTDLDGREIYPCAWKELNFVSDSIIAFREKNSYGLADKDGKILVPSTWSEYSFIQDQILYKRTGKLGLASAETGEILFAAQFDRFETIPDTRLVHVEKNGKQGVISLDGATILDCVYIGISEMPENEVFIVAKSGSDGVRFGLMSTNGEEIIPCEYLTFGDSLSGQQLEAAFSNGWMLCEAENGLWGFVNADGNIIAPVYESARSFSNSFAPVCLNGYWGFLNETGELAIEAKYVEVGDFYENGLSWALMQNGQYRYLSSDGIDYFVDTRYTQAREFENAEDYESALALYDELGDYDDCVRRAAAIRYSFGEAALAEEDFDTALRYFVLCNGYEDSAEKAEYCRKEPAYRSAVELQNAEEYAAAVEIFAELEDYKDSEERKMVCEEILAKLAIYAEAEAKLASADYLGSFELFTQLGDFRDAAERAKEPEAVLAGQRDSALALKDAGSYAEAKTAFETLSGYSDCAEQAEECGEILEKLAIYEQAETLMSEELYEEALALFEGLGDFSDAPDRVNEVQTIIDELPAYKAGKTVVFGSYEQDNDTGNGKEPIEWLVLDINEGENTALLISKYALDTCQYLNYRGSVTWETSTLRSWLNNNFLTEGFSKEEQERILQTVVDNSTEQGQYDTYSGHNTTDRIFCLSAEEALDYFDGTEARICEATEYAKTQEIYIGYQGHTLWWLRSPGSTSSEAMVVVPSGISTATRNVDYFKCGVRPALWVQIEE